MLQEFTDFIQAVERRGVGAMELVAMDMKLRGSYIARQLSFKGVQFRVETVTVKDEFLKVYNDSVKLVRSCRCPNQHRESLVSCVFSGSKRARCLCVLST